MASSPLTEMQVSIAAVEGILGYTFKNKKLLEEALTHSSIPNATSYERLEFIGDIALSQAISNHIFLTHPDLEPGKMSLLRAANVSTEKLARVAISHGLHRFVRHNVPSLVLKVAEFVQVVSQEDKSLSYGGTVKAPKILADIVESVTAAVYVDLNFDLKQLWMVISGIMEPMLTPYDLEQQPQPVTKLYELCQKNGKQVEIKHERNGDKSIVTVYVDGHLVATASSYLRDIARLEAAKIALDNLSTSLSSPMSANLMLNFGANDTFEIEGAKQKLHEICVIKKWPRPEYIPRKADGPPHARIFMSAVEVVTPGGKLEIAGDEKPRVKEGENSAASYMIRALQQRDYL